MGRKKENKTTYKVVGWTWWGDSDYIDAPLTDEVIDAVAEDIRKHGYCFGGDAHQNHSGCVPVLNTGQALRCSMRVWGSVMAAAELGSHFSMDYMLWYMDNCIQEDAIKYPEERVDESLFTHPHYFKSGMPGDRLERLEKEGKVIDVFATFDEPCNIDVGDIGVLCAFDGDNYDWVYARIQKVTRFSSPQEFIDSDLFRETDLVRFQGHELMVEMNSTRKQTPVLADDGITVYHYELLEIDPYVK